MVHHLLRAIGILFLFVTASSLAADPDRNLAVAPSKGGRFALVIGNAAYSGVAALKNPANDANDIAAKLRKLDFDVTVKVNVGLKEMLRALTAFGNRVQPDSEVLVFYAGHGMQVKGRNYLIPIDAEISNETAVSSEAVDVDQLLDKLVNARLSMVILDACRNNPFERRFRGYGQGLAQINAPTGTLIAYSTAPGKVASDGDGRNGLYTQELLAALDVPGIRVEDVFKRVRVSVVKLSSNAQTPWESSSLTGDFYFRLGAAAVIQPQLQHPSSAHQASSAAPVAGEAEKHLWSAVEQSNDAADYEIYLSEYPNGRFVTLAMARLDQFKQEAVAQAETKAWQGAEKGGRVEVEDYLERYPHGRYAGPALLRLTRFKKEEAEMRPGKVFKDCQACPEMVILPTGIAMSRTPITQKQWRAIMGGIPSQFANCGEDCPVEQVSWNDAREYIRALNQRTGKTYRLPKEQEWYAACKAGHETTYCGGDDLDSVAWQRRNSGNTVHPVAQKQPNSWGLYDMSGNVDQWMEDCHNSRCSSRMLRGGSWHSFEDSVRLGSTNGGDAEPSYRDSAIGFRVVR